MCKGKCGFDLEGEVFDDADFEPGDIYDDLDDSDTKAKVNVEDEVKNFNIRWNTKVRIIPKTMDDIDIYYPCASVDGPNVDLPDRFSTPKLTQIPDNKDMKRDDSSIFDDYQDSTAQEKKDMERDDSNIFDDYHYNAEQDYNEEDDMFQSEDSDDDGEFSYILYFAILLKIY